jgi:DNA-binding response OmpR family regulator
MKEKWTMAKKVLMIDDDPEFVEAISNLLDAKGYDVHTASNGKEGVEKAKAENPDIILRNFTKTRVNVARELHGREAREPQSSS